MTTGTVKFFNEHKGYGFIAPDGGGNDAFVHITAVERAGMRSLRENQRVSYDLAGRPSRQDGRSEPEGRRDAKQHSRKRREVARTTSRPSKA